MFVAYHLRGIVKYTLLMDPPVPSRYVQISIAPSALKQGAFFTYSLGTCLRASYRYFFKRAPVFMFGSWLGSKLVWSLEDAYGENSMVSTKTPLMIASGFAAYFVVYSRREWMKLVRAPAYMFSMTFATIWLVDNFIINNRGLDAFFNPLHLRLPPAAVSVLAGEPFNGELVLGPIKYAATSALDGVAYAGFALSDFFRKLPTTASARTDEVSKPSNAEERVKDLDSRILSLEESALVRAGYLNPSQLHTDGNKHDRMLDKRDELFEAYDKSRWNLLARWNTSPESSPRLTTLNLHFLNNLFGDRFRDVVTPIGTTKPLDEIVFGNLIDGIEQSRDANAVSEVRSQLVHNAQATRPRPLGVAAERGFFAVERQTATNILEHAVVDPIGVLLNPLVSVARSVSSWRPFSSQMAFDDRPGVFHANNPYGKNFNSAAASTSDERAKSSSSSTSANNASSQAYHSSYSFEKPENMPVQYDLPPLIPAEAVERQIKRVEAERAGIYTVQERLQDLSDSSSAIALQTGIAVNNTAAGAISVAREVKGIVQDLTRQDQPSGSDATKVPDRAQFSEPSTFEDKTDYERVDTWVHGIGGRDYDEPTRAVRLSKMPIAYSGSRGWYRPSAKPGERIVAATKLAASNLKEAISARVAVLTATEEDSPLAIRNQIRLEEQREAQMRRQRQAQQAEAKFHKEVVEPTKRWFADVKKRWFKD